MRPFSFTHRCLFPFLHAPRATLPSVTETFRSKNDSSSTLKDGLLVPNWCRNNGQGDIGGYMHCEGWAWVVSGHPPPSQIHQDLTWGGGNDETPSKPWGATHGMFGFDPAMMPPRGTVMLHRSVLLLWDNPASAKPLTWADYTDDVRHCPVHEYAQAR